MNSPTRGNSLVGRLRKYYDNTPLPAGQAIGLALDVVLERLWPAPLPGKRAFHRAAGAGLALAGCALTVWAWEERRRRTVGDFKLEQPEELVTTGPYAISRHPMYFGWWLIHLGSGVASGTAWVLVTVPVAVGVEHLGVLSEEATLAKSFGQAYSDYAARVPRYLRVPYPRRGARVITSGSAAPSGAAVTQHSAGAAGPPAGRKAARLWRR